LNVYIKIITAYVHSKVCFTYVMVSLCILDYCQGQYRCNRLLNVLPLHSQSRNKHLIAIAFRKLLSH